jgi:hypothetical protein
VPDIGDLNQILGNNPVYDAVGVSGSQKRAVSLKGVEHGRPEFREISQQL